MSKSNQQDAGQTCGGTGRVVVGGGALSGPCPGCRECDPAPKKDQSDDARWTVEKRGDLHVLSHAGTSSGVRPASDAEVHFASLVTSLREERDQARAQLDVPESSAYWKARYDKANEVAEWALNQEVKHGRIADQARADLTRITQERDASERLRLEQERSLNHKRDQALARAEEAEARLAEVEKVRDWARDGADHFQAPVGDLYGSFADRLDRALNETTSQEEGS